MPLMAKLFKIQRTEKPFELYLKEMVMKDLRKGHVLITLNRS
jgi:hypothetical protein